MESSNGDTVQPSTEFRKQIVTEETDMVKDVVYLYFDPNDPNLNGNDEFGILYKTERYACVKTRVDPRKYSWINHLWLLHMTSREYYPDDVIENDIDTVAELKTIVGITVCTNDSRSIKLKLGDISKDILLDINAKYGPDCTIYLR